MSNAQEIIKIVRRPSRPTSLQFINYIFSDFIEFHGDRHYKDDSSIIGGIALLRGRPVTVIAIQKGQTLDENIKRNFGSPNPEGYRKALRLMKQAEKFNRPVITLINTAGAYCGVGAEERGQGEAIARNLFEMSSLKTPILSIIIGEGGSGGALALAVADSVWMLENAIYSILSPEGFASILWKDSSRATEAAELMKLTSKDLLDLGIIDKIIPEPENGADRDFEFTAQKLSDNIYEEITKLADIDSKALTEMRYERFRKFGSYFE